MHWKYEGDFVNGQAEGHGKLTTEQEVVYEGTLNKAFFSAKTAVSKLETIFQSLKRKRFLSWIRLTNHQLEKLCEIKIFSIISQSSRQTYC